MSGVATGAMLLVASSLLATLEVTCIRFLEDATRGQILLFRAGGQIILASAVVAIAGGFPILRTKRLRIHLVRGGLSAGAWWMYYASFQSLDLALATTLSFSSQIFVVILAAFFLGERLTARGFTAALVGLFGIAVAVRIWNVQSVDGNAFYGLAGAFLGAVMLVITRSLSRTERTQTIMFYIGVVVFAVALPQGLMDWKPLNARDLMLLTIMGLCGTCSMWLMVEAYRYAGASFLAPFSYLRLIFSAAVGAVLFGELIQIETFIGAGLIVASALLIIAESRSVSQSADELRPNVKSILQKNDQP